jgi:hypothetical protein
MLAPAGFASLRDELPEDVAEFVVVLASPLAALAPPDGVCAAAGDVPVPPEVCPVPGAGCVPAAAGAGGAAGGAAAAAGGAGGGQTPDGEGGGTCEVCGWYLKPAASPSRNVWLLIPRADAAQPPPPRATKKVQYGLLALQQLGGYETGS